MIGCIVTFEQIFKAYSMKISEEELVAHLQSLLRQYAAKRQYKPLEQVDFFQPDISL